MRGSNKREVQRTTRIRIKGVQKWGYGFYRGEKEQTRKKQGYVYADISDA